MSGETVLLEKLEQFIVFCESLHAENHALRERVARLEEEERVLRSKIDSARSRLEALVDRLPAETEPVPEPNPDLDPDLHSEPKTDPETAPHSDL